MIPPWKEKGIRMRVRRTANQDDRHRTFMRNPPRFFEAAAVVIELRCTMPIEIRVNNRQHFFCFEDSVDVTINLSNDI